MSETTRQKIGRGNQEKISARKGKKCSQKTIEKIREATKKQWAMPGRRESVSQKLKGHKVLKNTRDKISISLLGHTPWNKTNKIDKKCVVCGTNFKVVASRKKRAKCCSARCVGLYTIKKIKRANTDIEQIIEKWLKKNYISYEKQKPIGGLTLVDFFIPPNICLYADGDYWHNLGNRRERDNLINEKLKKQGYKIIRLLGSEIHNGKRPQFKRYVNN